jgi:hypothetical protein
VPADIPAHVDGITSLATFVFLRRQRDRLLVRRERTCSIRLHTADDINSDKKERLSEALFFCAAGMIGFTYSP